MNAPGAHGPQFMCPKAYMMRNRAYNSHGAGYNVAVDILSSSSGGKGMGVYLGAVPAQLQAMQRWERACLGSSTSTLHAVTTGTNRAAGPETVYDISTRLCPPLSLSGAERSLIARCPHPCTSFHPCTSHTYRHSSHVQMQPLTLHLPALTCCEKSL